MACLRILANHYRLQLLCPSKQQQFVCGNLIQKSMFVGLAGVNEVVLRFHKTKIVRIRPNGDMMLTSGGWYTATTGQQMQLVYALH